MRIWAFDDIRAMGANLVLEQDFIMRIRRLRRMGAAHLVANVRLGEFPSDYGGLGQIEDAQQRVQLLVQTQKGFCAAMSNGDLFLVWPVAGAAGPVKAFPERALAAALPEGYGPEDVEKHITVYALPEQYDALRERVGFYIDLSKTAADQTAEPTPAQWLQTEAARGVLTAWSLNQIEKLAEQVDLSPFLRAQVVYERQPDGRLQPAFEENYMGLQDLRQMYFPHLDIAQPKHLFLDLCRVLDQALLTTMARNYEMIGGREVSLNLSLSTILGLAFAQFTHAVPRPMRHKIRFEIHCGDLMQDFTQTLAAFATLREEDYMIAIDGIVPEMLPYINFGRFIPDYIKIDASKENLRGLQDKAFKEALSKIRDSKVVFSRCDSEQAFAMGASLGVPLFQGWHVDDLVARQQ